MAYSEAVFYTGDEEREYGEGFQIWLNNGNLFVSK